MSDANPFSDVAESAKAVGRFMAELAFEGERSAVVLGASRADTALDALLKKCMRSNPGGSDNLFDAERPLGTFSAKISLAFRLGLIDEPCEHALQILRKLRNDFAHSTSVTTLSESRNRSRLMELVNDVRKSGLNFDDSYDKFKKVENEYLRLFCAATATVIMILDFTTLNIKQFEPAFVASFPKFAEMEKNRLAAKKST